jgi:hypothetical protein
VGTETLSKSGSDHTPLLLDSREQPHIGSSKKFLFELSWLKKDGFVDIVTRERTSVPHGHNPIFN